MKIIGSLLLLLTAILLYIPPPFLIYYDKKADGLPAFSIFLLVTAAIICFVIDYHNRKEND